MVCHTMSLWGPLQDPVRRKPWLADAKCLLLLQLTLSLLTAFAKLNTLIDTVPCLYGHDWGLHSLVVLLVIYVPCCCGPCVARLQMTAEQDVQLRANPFATGILCNQMLSAMTS